MSEQDENLIAYCGLYCGDCLNYKGEIADLARDLRKKLREAKFAQVAHLSVRSEPAARRRISRVAGNARNLRPAGSWTS